MPSCSCLDWRQWNLPCNHMFALFQLVPEWNWYKLPKGYLVPTCQQTMQLLRPILRKEGLLQHNWMNLHSTWMNRNPTWMRNKERTTAQTVSGVKFPGSQRYITVTFKHRPPLTTTICRHCTWLFNFSPIRVLYRNWGQKARECVPVSKC